MNNIYDHCLFLVFYEFNSSTSDWNCSRKIKVLPLFAIGRNTYSQSTNNEYVSRICKTFQDCFHLFVDVFFVWISMYRFIEFFCKISFCSPNPVEFQKPLL